MRREKLRIDMRQFLSGKYESKGTANNHPEVSVQGRVGKQTPRKTEFGTKVANRVFAVDCEAPHLEKIAFVENKGSLF